LKIAWKTCASWVGVGVGKGKNFGCGARFRGDGWAVRLALGLLKMKLSTEVMGWAG
jgi:hypothetical protein